MTIPQVTMTMDFPCKNHYQFCMFENQKFSLFLLINIYFSTIKIITTSQVTMSMNIILTAIIQCKIENISNKINIKFKSKFTK